MGERKNWKVHFVLLAAFLFVFFSAVVLILSSRYIDDKLLESNEKDAMDLAQIVTNNFDISDSEVAYMKTLTFNEMEVDPINRRLLDVGTGVKLDAPTISIYIVAPLQEEEIKYSIEDLETSEFFGLEVGTPLNAIWLCNAAISEDGTAILKERDDIYRYTHITDEMEYGFEQKDAFGTFSEDEWGAVITGYAPVYTVEGNFVGLLGIDMDIDEYQQDVHKMVSKVIVLFFASAVVLFGLFFFFYLKYIQNQKAKMYFDFYSTISHDMRTPMNGIIGLTELAESENDPVEMHQYFKKIEESSNYLLSLINDTLDVGKISNGKMTLQPETIGYVTLIDNIVDMVRESAKNRKVYFQELMTFREKDCYVKVDPMRFKQIFVNLLSNAIKFTPEGGTVIFDIECEKTEKMMMCVFTIKDTGVGMSKDFMERRMFQPFSQEKNSRTELYTGSGLGLSIVKYLVDQMNGTITVQSEVGIGTTFVVDINLPCVERPEGILQEEKKVDYKEILPGKKVLLCEDHPLNTEIAKKLLEKMGCVVEVAVNGKIGLERFAQSSLNEFDAVLMDIRMPEMDGMEATKRIRSLPREDAMRVPIIAMTANAYEEDIRHSKEAGMNEHLSKPIQPIKLYETLAYFIDKYEKA